MKPLHTPADNRRRAAFDPNISAVKLAAMSVAGIPEPPLSLANLVQAQGGKP